MLFILPRSSSSDDLAHKEHKENTIHEEFVLVKKKRSVLRAPVRSDSPRLTDQQRNHKVDNDFAPLIRIYLTGIGVNNLKAR